MYTAISIDILIFGEETNSEDFDISEISSYVVLEQETFEKLYNAIENMQYITYDGLIENNNNLTNFRV